jgi:hypothetical protein
LAHFAADAFDQFLHGKCDSLDEAFRVAQKGPGAPRKLSLAKNKLRQNKKILAMRLAGKSWYDIEETTGIDKRVHTRDLAPWKARLLSREISARDLGLHPRRTVKAPRNETSHMTEEERWEAWQEQNDRAWATYLRLRDGSSSRPPVKKLRK